MSQADNKHPYDPSKTVWISRWALTRGIFEIEAEPHDGWVEFIHPWTKRTTGAGPGDWHQDRHGALRQAATKKRNEIRILLSRAKSMNNRKIQEYELRDLDNPAKPLRETPTDILAVKNALKRPGMERVWGDAEMTPRSQLGDEDYE